MSSKFKTLITITIVVLFTIVLHYIGWLRPIENIIRNIVNPSSNFIYNINIEVGNNEENFESVEELKEAYKNLKLDLESRQLDVVQFDLLQEENEELRLQLEYFSANNYKHVGAQVIGKNIDPLPLLQYRKIEVGGAWARKACTLKHHSSKGLSTRLMTGTKD